MSSSILSINSFKSKHWASPRQRVFGIGPAANISFLLITPETAGFQPMTPGTGIKCSNHSAVRLGQGWAGIPVPVHSQEWKPLIPFPELWEWIFSFPSRSRISGMLFFHSLPVPELWEWFFFIPFPFPNCGNGFFSFPSRSRIVGMDFFNSLPIPEFAISQTGIKTGIGLL